MSHQVAGVKRTLGAFDLTMLLIVAVVNLNLVPAVAGSGAGVLPLWGLAFFLFFLPQAVAVIELSSRYDEEGGVYVWSKAAFGDFHGFVSGWCYWVNNIFYIPTLLFYVVGFCLYVLGGEGGLAENTAFMTFASLLLLWAAVGISIRGAGFNKWVQNCGALGTCVAVAAVVVFAAAALTADGAAGALNLQAALATRWDWRTCSLLGLVCFAFVGLELGSVQGGEIKKPRRTIPKAVVIAGACCVALYLLCSFAVQATIPPGETEVISGLLQAAERMAAASGLGPLVKPLALILGVSVAGALCAWLAGSARIPFVVGLDSHLPRRFGRVHGRYRTPHVALAAQGVAITVVLLLSSAGSSVRDVYLLLLNTAVIIQLIPFLYVFAALVKMRGAGFRSERAFFRRAWPCYVAGGLGFAVTLTGIFLALVPPEGVESTLLYEIKMLSACVCFIAPAVFIFRRGARADHELPEPRKETSPVAP